MKIRTLKIDSLKPSSYNPRVPVTKGSKEYEDIASSLREHGLVEPIVVNENTMTVIGGHQRLIVMKDLGYTEVECSLLDIKDENQEKKLNLSLNKIKGDWDMEKLEALLTDSEVTAFETGFEEGEIDFSGLLGSEESSEQEPDLTGLEDDLEDSLDDEAEYSDADEGVKETNGVCYFSSFRWKIPVETYKQLMADIRSKGCFTKQEIVEEIIRRVTND